MAMTDNELLKADKEGRVDVAAGTAGGGMMMPAGWREIQKWLESPWEGKP